MKKSIASKATLQAHALKTGATVTNEAGKSFNTARKKSTTVVTRKPKPAIPPQPPGPDAGAVLLAEKIDDLSKANIGVINGLKAQISQLQFEAATPPTEWVFDMIRNSDGFITQIKAKAVQVLN